MAEKRRVLLIIPNLDFGGAQTSFSRLSWLLEPHCSLLLVVFNKDNIAPLTFGGELVELHVAASNAFHLKLINFYRRVKRLKAIKKKFRPDVSISFLEGADYVNLLSSIGEEIFFYIHGSKKFDRNIKGLIGSIQKKILIPILYRFADKILVVNERLKTELIEHFALGNSSFEILPNFFNIKELQDQALAPLSDSLNEILKDDFSICISGRLAPEKGIDRFVSLLPEILKKHSALKVLIVGDGQLKEEIKNQLKTLGISFSEMQDDVIKSANVLFLGYQKNPYRFLGRSTLLVLPSLNEGMPNTIIEALCLGIPIISSDCPYGPRELLAINTQAAGWPELAEYGVLVPLIGETHESKKVWVEAIFKLLESPELRNRYSMKGKIRGHDFSMESNVLKWKMVLNIVNQ
jgi:glycosyltransferase involved in cell wall biosynthesis